MPTLRGTEGETKTIRMVGAFRVTRKENVRISMKKTITDICWKCTEDGYYIVGLESVLMDEDTVSWNVKYTLELMLRVRQFAEPLSQEDIAHWAPQFCERILFEFFQLGNSPPEIKAEIAVAMERIATSTGVVDEIRRKDPRDSATFVKLKKMIDNDEIKFPKQEVDESPKWEIIHLGASDVEQPDSK